MNGRCSRPGGQGSSGSTTTTTPTTTTTTTTTPTTTTTDTEGDIAANPFGWVGSGENGEWSEEDDTKTEAVAADIKELQTRGELKSDTDIKRYLNELMEDDGITLAQYEVIKIILGIE